MDVDLPMAGTAKSDQVFFHIATQMALQVQMRDLEISGTSASLAAPVIACEHLLAKPPVGIRIQSNHRLSREG
jgi:hypothetical protein